LRTICSIAKLRVEAVGPFDKPLVLEFPPGTRPERVLTEAQEAIASVIGASFSFAVIREPLGVVGVIGGEQVPLSLLPDGAKSILSWLGDLLMRLDRLPKPAGVQGVDLPFVLLLDEVEVHLHPAWQRRILPMIERLFPNAQIFLSTHSAFVVGSASDATIVLLRSDGTVSYEHNSRMGKSYTAIAEELMGVSSEFGIETEGLITEFEALKTQVLLHNRELSELELKAAQPD
jgi:predicted ATP-binding protein involved in virulence